jgi:tetratricopeptide (TPR) repeat protein
MMKKKGTTYCILFGLLFVVNSVWGQTPEAVLSILENGKSISYDSLEHLIQPLRKDSVFIKTLSEANKNPMAQSFALNVLGMNARNKSDFKSAIALHQKALDIAQEIKSKDLEVSSLNMIGVAYRRLDEVRLALEYHKQALSIAEKVRPVSVSILKSKAVSLNSIGNIYLVLKQYDLAGKQFEQSLKIEEKVNNKLGLAINYQNLGFIAEAKQKLDSALFFYKRSLKYNQEINSTIGNIICQNSIAQILIKQNKTQEGLNLILSSLPAAEKLGDKYYIGMAKVNAGWAQSKLRDFENAEKNLKEGLQINLENDFKSSISETYSHLSALFEMKGDYKTSLQYLKDKQEYADKVLNEENLRYTADLIVKYDNEKKESQIALLEKENEIVKIKLNQNQRILIFAGVLFSLLAILAFIWYRQRELNTEKSMLKLEQQMMRSQMNPHFLFNSLNSIKLYIINNDKEKAVYYLNKFSKLIRTILTNSQEKEISLQEELDTTELYLNIENIRFTDKIAYSVKVENGINPEQIKIPSLLLQPFIENSIWHGLSNRESNKQIQVNIKHGFENNIVIEIIDNGIGRVKAQEIKASKVSKQKSVGIELTRERLANFAKNNKGEMLLVFEDMYDSNQQPLGTKVILNIPQ